MMAIHINLAISRNKTWHFRAIKLGKTATFLLTKQHVVVHQFRARLFLFA